jgi:hypothetical protein
MRTTVTLLWTPTASSTESAAHSQRFDVQYSHIQNVPDPEAVSDLIPYPDLTWGYWYIRETVVGEVTVTKLLRYVISYFLKELVTISLHLNCL